MKYYGLMNLIENDKKRYFSFCCMGQEIKNKKKDALTLSKKEHTQKLSVWVSHMKICKK